MEGSEQNCTWELLGLGFNGYQQLICQGDSNKRPAPKADSSSESDKPSGKDHSATDVSVSSPVSLMAFSGQTRPELSVSFTWDSLHVSSLSDTHTTGRWRGILTDSKLAKYKITSICEVGLRMILSTDSKVLVARKDQLNEKVEVSEQEKSGTHTFSALEDQTMYTLLDNGEVHECSFSTVSKKDINDKVATCLSIGPQLSTGGVAIGKVCCGADHLLLLSSTGSLFSLGMNSRGQLGHGDIETRTQPTLIAALDGLAMKDIACGHWHCLALSEFGDVYSWGWNRHKQLGHSEHLATVPMPTLVQVESEDVNIVCVGCGSKHSVGLSEGGVVYGWGWNGYGQLEGKQELIVDPQRLSLPGHLRPVHVYCGYWNTLVLCANCTVCTP